MLAGGTGITPMVRIFSYLQENIERLKFKSVVLLFFNQEEKDIIWRAEWTALAAKFNWFSFIPVLTRQPARECLQGRIDCTLLKDSLNAIESFKSAKVRKAIICGTHGFTVACEK